MCFFSNSPSIQELKCDLTVMQFIFPLSSCVLLNIRMFSKIRYMLKKIYLNIYLNCPVKKKQHLRFNFAKKNVNHEQCYVAKKSKPIYSTRRKAKVAVIVTAF